MDEIMRWFDSYRELYDLEKKIIEPLTHIIEREDEILVILDLPCIEKKDISIKSTEDTLIISAECYRKSIKLPARVDPRHAKAYFDHGVLQITLPKKLEGREIEVE